MTASGPWVRLLNRAALVRAGGWDFGAAADDVIRAVQRQAEGLAIMPSEVALRWPVDGSGDTCRGQADVGVYALPAMLGGPDGMAGVKWSSHRPPTGDPRVPRILGVLILNDPVTAVPVAVMESSLVGTVRTAAVSCVAIERLGRSRARRVAIVGAGAQAEGHLRMLADRLPGLEGVRLFNRTRARAERLVAGLDPAPPWPVQVVDHAEAAFRDSDIVITCTSAARPYVERDWIRPGLLAIHVGMFEFTYDAIAAFDRVVVDGWGEFKHTSLQSLFRMYRDQRFDEADVHADLGDLVAGRQTVAAEESVMFNSFGLGVFDVAVASRLLRRAVELEEGVEWPLGG